jgi:hypothetical protein
LIDELDVIATLAVEGGERVVYARCVLGQKTLSIASRTIHGTGRNQQRNLVLSARLVLPAR